MTSGTPIKLAALASACILAGIASSATTAPATDASTGYDARLGEALQRDLGMTAAQVPQYLAAEKAAATQGASLVRDLGAAYAGSWLERGKDGTYRFVVATSGASSTAARARAAASGVEVRQMRFPLSELRTSKARLDDLQGRTVDAGTALRGVQSWGIDPKTNSVTITTSPGGLQAGIDFAAASGIDVDQVRFETRALDVAPQAVIKGGKRYDIDNGSWCSIGFAVMHNGAKAFLTAGHCGEKGNRVAVDGEPAGAFARSQYPGTDRALVRMGDQHQLSPWIEKPEGANAVRGKQRAPVGAAVCRSGARTGYRCGEILRDDLTVRYRNGAVIYNMTETSACSGGGDSGGSWITPSGNAQGIHSGGTISENDNACQLPKNESFTYYTRVNLALEEFGATLVMKPD